VLPKLHLRFDEFGEPDQVSSEYSLRPRIIQALQQNLLVGEAVNECKRKKETPAIISQKHFINETLESLKPRIIKAIII